MFSAFIPKGCTHDHLTNHKLCGDDPAARLHSRLTFHTPLGFDGPAELANLVKCDTHNDADEP